MTLQAEVVVIGGGHAGCEAALAAARLGADTLMLVINPDKIGHISCNPAVGGVAKGQLVREIDALGGAMGLAADHNVTQFKMLNSSRGLAVRSPRVQIDRWAYQDWMKSYLERTPGIRIRQDQAVALVVEDGRVRGVRTFFGEDIACQAVVVAAGTFSRARLHLGGRSWEGGRNGEPAAAWLSASLEELGIELFRLRTDTCPRVDGRSLDYSRLQPQPGDSPPQPFSFLPVPEAPPPLLSYGAWTNAETIAVVRKILDRAPAITGAVAGLPPRYCPNIETKVAYFPEKKVHHLFIEPEGRNSNETYLNGFSTSIPPEAQDAMIRSVKGMEEARVVRYGYAVEYDAVRPTQLKATLESKKVAGLFTAGQLNGSSGYEEAAAQGLLAGVNAALLAQGRPPFVLGRHEAYLGVLVDDLTTLGTEEPYRLFTSRSEYRLSLRQDNADLRLTEKAAAIGLVGEDRLSRVTALKREMEQGRLRLAAWHSAVGQDLWQILKRPETTWEDITRILPALADITPRVREQLSVDCKYEGYIAKSLSRMRELERHRAYRLPDSFDYAGISGLSREAREKLSRLRPENLDQARRISGVSPADAALLLVHLRQRQTA
ncbi:MAG: tRNA uridine-5-carboxymethylaminomethyl(34) synthesis enzyme MnmG [Planctomycetota bacterium]|jgi:tRNA uridine 5-carboxymethylaminomethyl modification enzyme|nr:tRNA uridine-5-carboxymethylaminomethyl(34) synthesis enzyme MnmG [Planctomycetota bacterium]